MNRILSSVPFPLFCRFFSSSPPPNVYHRVLPLLSSADRPLIAALGSPAVSNSATLRQFRIAQAVDKFSRKPGDCGSSEVQIAVFSERISTLEKNFAGRRVPPQVRRGLEALKSRRRKLLKYLRRTKPEVYLNIVKECRINVAVEVDAVGRTANSGNQAKRVPRD